ncbi:MAG: TolC family protein [Leptospirales bacterium]
MRCTVKGVFSSPRFSIVFRMMSGVVACLCFLSTSWADSQGIPESATSPPSHPITVDQAVAMALSRNPDILSFKKAWKGTRKLEVTALAPADPQIQYLYGGGEQGNGPNGQGLPYSSGSNWAVFQSFLFPGKAQVGYKINKDNTKSAYYAYRTQRVTLRNQTEVACYQLLLGQKTLALNLEMQSWFKRVLDITRAKLSVGSAQILDVVNAKVQLSQSRLDQLTYEWQVKVARRQLNMLLNLPLDAPTEVSAIPSPRDLPLSLAQLEDMALVNRPDLLTAKTTLDLNRHQLSLSKLGYLPDYQFEASEGGESCYSFAGINCYYLGVQINIPIFAPIKQTKQVESARDMVRSADFQYEWQANQVKLNVDNTYSQVLLGYRQFLINETQIVPQTRLAFELALTGYENQKNDFLYLINAIQGYRQARYNRFQSQINYYESLSNLEAAIGSPISLAQGPVSPPPANGRVP